MVGIKLQGRLGNQLFQYAFVHTVSKKLETSFFIEQSDQRFMLADYFNIPVNLDFFLQKYLFTTKRLKKYYYKILNKYYISRKIAIPADTIYDVVIKKLNDDTLFEGFFLSEKFFKSDMADIQKYFTLKPHFQKKYKKKYGVDFSDKKLISVHIRKDDYLNLGHLNLGAEDLSIPMTYYHNLITRLQEKNVLFIFLSDDVDFVKSEFAYLENKFISNDSMINDFQHLLIADICIIANSTFSWWGAWLNNNKNKIIYAPEHFMGHYINETWPADIYPENWRLVNVHQPNSFSQP